MSILFTRGLVKALVVILVVTLPPLTGIAQVPSPTVAAATGGDPPGRVARLNYFAGTVTLKPAGLSEWSYAVLNRPLTTGDQVWVDTDSRAELHAGSTALWLNQQTSLDVVTLNDTTSQLKVTQGTLSAHVRALPTGQNFEIDTPNVALVATAPGLFRVDLSADGSLTTVTVRSGNVTLYGDGESFQMSAGQQFQFVGTNLQHTAGGTAPGPGGFDQWVASRDRSEDNSVSARYVSREILGYEDLDANGTWRSNPTYGEVWVPAVVSTGWAPYHAGHWAWIAPWGWTWVDDAPWGFAPFHYGRWAYVDRTWAWVPGPVVVAQPPIYSPALVAFVGGGERGGGGMHWGIDLSIGGAVGSGVAWFALGPGEPWQPPYHTSPAYFSRVNNVNTTRIHNTYINMNAPGAIAAVPASTFVRGQQVASAALPITAQQIVHAQIGAGAPAIAPVRESFTGGMHAANVGAPAELAQRRVVATHPPVEPAAYHDLLAQRFADSGGRVANAGDPVVRTTVPANLTPNFAHSAPADGKPAGARTYGNFLLTDRAVARPMQPQSSAAHSSPPSHQEPTVPREIHNAARPETHQQQDHPNQGHESGVPQSHAQAHENLPQDNATVYGQEAPHGPPHGVQHVSPQNAHPDPQHQPPAESPGHHVKAAEHKRERRDTARHA